jgi:hypothetical protein
MLSMLLVTALAVAQYPAPAEKPAAQDTARARTATSSPAAGSRDTMKARTPTTAAALREDMRRLWADHITYTHHFIVSHAAGLGDTAQVTQRLLRNQDELGDAIKPFYGDAAGGKLAGLLRGHITLAAQAFAAAKGSQTTMATGWQSQWNRDTTAKSSRGVSRDTSALARGRDTTGMKAHADSGHMGVGMANAAGTDTMDLNAAVAALRANADSIASFLNSANPRHWSKASLQAGLNMHLDLLLQQVKTRLRGDWAAHLAAFEDSHRQARQMADMLADGIVKQFPTRFTTKTTAMTSR